LTENLESVLQQLDDLRRRFDEAFAPDTALPGSDGPTASAGHCAVVAAVIQQRLGGELLSTTIQGEPHWLNRLFTSTGAIDFDLTGDQYGCPPVQVAFAGGLYGKVLVRPFAELLPETLERAAVFAARAGMPDVAGVLNHACGTIAKHERC
jgi:hypothetical protein